MKGGKLDVVASVSGNQDAPVRGELTFLDNAVDFTTGTIQLKAEFTNKDRALWPGQFSNVTVTLTEQKDAVVVPFEAVQTGQQGQYAFVLKPDSTVEYRLITAGRILGKEIIIEKGLAPGDAVVTDGQLRLANGSKVKVVETGEKAD
jgi:multidrug efflux system membrane fusion protein